MLISTETSHSNPSVAHDKTVARVGPVRRGTTSAGADELRPGAAILAHVEPFVDVATESMRRKLLDDSIVSRFEQILAAELAALLVQPGGVELVKVLAEIKADIHYLKAAYLTSERYVEPAFDNALPETVKQRPVAERLSVDMRAHVTGRNWYDAEGDGRWAGPEAESSLVLPALLPGRYKLIVNVVDEIVSETIDNMRLEVNGQAVELSRASRSVRTPLAGSFRVEESYALPFWTFKFLFDRSLSPATRGSEDQRVLTVRFAGLDLERVSP